MEQVAINIVETIKKYREACFEKCDNMLLDLAKQLGELEREEKEPVESAPKVQKVDKIEVSKELLHQLIRVREGFDVEWGETFQEYRDLCNLFATEGDEDLVLDYN